MVQRSSRLQMGRDRAIERLSVCRGPMPLSCNRACYSLCDFLGPKKFKRTAEPRVHFGLSGEPLFKLSRIRPKTPSIFNRGIEMQIKNNISGIHTRPSLPTFRHATKLPDIPAAPRIELFNHRHLIPSWCHPPSGRRCGTNQELSRN